MLACILLDFFFLTNQLWRRIKKIKLRALSVRKNTVSMFKNKFRIAIGF